ncbi:histidine ammonia-lyase [Rhodocaloribacter litoris]|uniref:histidine ammonia-lyase n=1 Tax=Rhodocaloribacter litoris TaxID=2558931 RepID=UPI001421562B|nr:histidine ammonia-lyase [Rhodocaloribacter litoris]QXD14425.1 histidine ammonia-lyase [Rhodocaloribacter litoris]
MRPEPLVYVTIAHLYEDLCRSLDMLRRDDSAVRRSRAVVERALADGGTYYGINTGFGKLARVRIPADQQARLQRNLLLSHAVGVGEPIPRDVTRLMLHLKIHALGLGYSGVSPETFHRLLLFAEKDWVPVVPSKGSVGASGDLAPLAHLALPLLGLGAFWRPDGAGTVPAADVLAAHGLAPIDLQPKDGLALINGTQMMSAYGAYVLEKGSRLVRTADLLAAMSLEALQGSIKPFDARIQAVRPHPGQARVAENVRHLLEGSEILESHRDCGKVQDPYCLRCVPQVHGAGRDALAYATRVVETEINAVTDNPLVFEDGDILSGGNFHGQPLALALDVAAMALAELASISERRIYLLLEGHDGLPTLLMRETGLNSGFMIPQYTAAALVSENKVLCHPASVDSIPTSLGQEDHVSMGSISALKLVNVLRNLEHVLAIELLTAAQALDYRLPLRPGRGVEAAHRYVRRLIPHREADYLFQEDLLPCLDLIRTDALLDAVAEEGCVLA